MTNEELEQTIKELKDRLNKLETKRIFQQDLMPDSVKMRHIAEGVRFIRGGVTAGKPTSGEEPMQGNAIYFDETTSDLYVWNKTNQAWESTTLS